MKYHFLNSPIPQNRRAEINQKLLRVIESDSDAISAQDIYNAYTGDGGLHGLSASDFNNFHEYTEAKKEIEVGQFFTPHSLSDFLVQTVKPGRDDLVADLTCGIGNFFNFLPSEGNIYGVELDIKAYKVAKHLYPKAHIECTDMRYWDPSERFDVILGNPPFNLKWGESTSQMVYTKKAHELLRAGGLLALIVPLSFLSDEFANGGEIREIDERFNFVFQTKLDPTAFKQYGVDYYETKLMVFQKRSEHLVHTPYQASVFVEPMEAFDLHMTYIQPVLELKEEVRHKLFFENNRTDDAEHEFSYKVRKLLFDIKRNPRISEKHAKAVAYVERYYTQKMPEGMTYEQWQLKKITKAKVLSYLNRIVKNQHVVERDEIRMVKTKYGIRLKGYSKRMRSEIKKAGRKTEFTFADMILDEKYPFRDRTYWPLFQRKMREYQRQSAKFLDMSRDTDIDAFLDRFQITNHRTGKIILLNQFQKRDIGLLMQKRYGILNWQQGSGKTPGALAWAMDLLENSRVPIVFIVAPANAIHMNWRPRLTEYQVGFSIIGSLKDISNIRDGQFVLVTFDMLRKYRKQIQKFVKMRSQKVALVVDESDEMTNERSKRTRATLACFRRVKYKLLTTGTVTRNNINELYAQLELLYNNSINMLCECDTVYETDKDNDIVDRTNDHYMKPFPAYRGASLWKSSFCPSKATVFGIGKFNQDIYNADALQNLIEKTMITRKFEEVVGEKKHRIITEPNRIDQNDSERAIYLKIMKEFYSMVYKYFQSTGNTRKDSGLMLVRQIQLLIKATSTPHLMDEYGGNELPNKFLHIVDMVRSFDEKVAIGTVFLDTAEEYHRVLQEAFPERPVFLIKGDVTFRKRENIIREFEDTTNGILISTQQSLKSSINIPSCNKVIVESMQWNLPKIEQYYFRFIRYDSTNNKEVHFVTYDRTIEQNIMALLMTKERINEYIKTLEFKDQADVFDSYDVDLSVLNSIIEKNHDENGRVYLDWGAQKVS